jgi:hypothetical protein
MLPIPANREVYRLLREGIPVQVRRPDNSLKDERVTVIDWTNPLANDFFLASQVWIESSLYRRRPDALGFVNGIPLLLIEWKDATKPVQEAYEANLRDYRDTIPRLFDFNGFTVLSNGTVRGRAWRLAQDRRQVSSGSRGQPRHRGGATDRREPGPSWRVLAHTGQRQEPVDGHVRREGAAAHEYKMA